MLHIPICNNFLSSSLSISAAIFLYNLCHGVSHHQYADDTQLFLAMRASTMQADLLKLEACTRDVKSWFAENNLLLNADKSEVMMIGTSSQLRLAETTGTVTVADSCLTVSSQLKSLGVIFDPRLTFEAHVSSVCKACNYHLLALRHIRRVLPQDVAKTIASSIVGSRLDYCNAVLYGTPNSTTSKLYRRCRTVSLASCCNSGSLVTHDLY